jgi:hypothetical protein
MDGPPPETCQHKVIQSIPLDDETPPKDWIRICTSCDSTLSDEFLDERVWDYDIDHNVWIHVPQKGPKRTDVITQIPWAAIVGFRIDGKIYAPQDVEIVLQSDKIKEI